MSELIISVSGLRGIVGQTLTPETAVRYAAAFASVLPPGPVVLSRDGRPSGPLLADAVRSALCAAGRRVIDAGVAATPTVGVLVGSTSAAGGIQVSASHNPPAYNGIKLMAGDGRVISADLGAMVAERFREGQAPWARHNEIGDSTIFPDPHAEHLRLVLSLVDVARIQQRRFAVVLDSNHGAGGLLGRRLLRALGCRVTALGAEPHGRFAHRPEPTAENLQSVLQQVVQADAAAGFCQDPDADRLALVDEQGRYVGEEYTLALCLAHVLRQRSGAVVTNCATSRMSEDLARRHGVPFFRSAVGEAHVADAMLKHEAVFGGEGNGGPIDPRVGLVRDSFVGMALLLDALAARDMPLSQLAAELPRYAIHKTKIEVDRAQIPAALDRLEQAFSDAQASRLDGLRLDWPDRWLLLRASNTEPIVRAIAEAQTAEQAEQLCHRALAAFGGN